MRLEFQCFRLFWIWPLLLLGCAASPRPTSEVSALAPAPKPALLPNEAHLADLRQLTFGGENAEAYWSFDGNAARLPGAPRRRGLRPDLPDAPLDGAASPSCRVSSGKGATTCAYFLPGDQRADLRLDAPGRRRLPAEAGPQPGLRLGALRHYDIFKANADGSGLTRAHDATKGYDAEAPSAARTARSSSPRRATATSSSTGWTPTART